MSSFKRTTRHPIRKDWQWASWIDNLFGGHKYGVVFPSDERKYGENTPLLSIAFDPEKIKLETKEDDKLD